MKKLKRKEIADILEKCVKGELHGIFYLNNKDCWGKDEFCHSELLLTIEHEGKIRYKFDKWWLIFDENGYVINDCDKYKSTKTRIEYFDEDTAYNKYAPFIFKDVADAVLNSGLKGDFVLRSGQKYSSELLQYDKYSAHQYCFPGYGENVDEYGLCNKYSNIKYWHDVIGFIPRTKEHEKRFIEVSFPEAQQMYYRGGEERELALRAFTYKELTQQ